METIVKVTPQGVTESNGTLERALLKILISMIASDLAQDFGRIIERARFDEDAIEESRFQILNADCSLAGYEYSPGTEERETAIRMSLEKLIAGVNNIGEEYIGPETDARVFRARSLFREWQKKRIRKRPGTNRETEPSPRYGKQHEWWLYGREHEWWMQPHIEIKGVLKGRSAKMASPRLANSPNHRRYKRRLHSVQQRYRIQVARIRVRAAEKTTPQAQRGELVKALNKGEIEVADYKKALADFRRPPKQFGKRSVFEKGIDDRNTPSKKQKQQQSNKKQQKRQKKGGKK